MEEFIETKKAQPMLADVLNAYVLCVRVLAQKELIKDFFEEVEVVE